MRLSFTRLADWRRCRQRYEWKYVQHIDAPSSPGQLRGKAGHSALAAYYGGMPAEQAILAGLVELEELGREGSEDRQLMKAVLERYFRWAKLNDDWRVVAVEQELKGSIGGYDVIGYVDLLVRKLVGGRPRLCIVDHKFQRNAAIEEAILSPQLAMYEELVRQNYGEEPGELIYNIVRTVIGGQAAATPVVRVRAQIKPSRRRLWLHEVIAQAGEMAAFHNGEAAGPRIYRNQTSTCNWDCPFYQRCLVLDSEDVPE